MPIKTSSLSIKALPLEVVNRKQSEKMSQILSPSSILPTMALFTLQVTTDASAKLTYKITAQQSNNLMQKSALFYDLSTQYTDYAQNNGSSLEELVQEADGLPMLCIELTNISTEIIDNLLQWLYSNNNNNNEIKFDDILTSTLASSIKSTFDFFSLLNFATLLDLYEPYCSIIDKILVWYYFGLNEQERNLEILKNDSFVKGTIPARFVKRLAESVSKFEENQILSSFFRGNIPSEEIFSTKGNEDDYESDTGDDNNVSTEISRSNILEWLNSNVITPTSHRVTFSLPNSPSPLDIAEPPTPLGSAYFCISPPPNTPYSPTFQRILPLTPKNATFRKISLSSINKKITLENDDIMEDIPLTAGLSVPPNTPNLLAPNSPAAIPNSPNNIIVPPNTPMSPANIIAPPNTPNLLVPNSPAAIPNSPNNILVPPNTPMSPANMVVPPNTPNLLVPNSPTNVIVPPNTPISPANIIVPPNTPNFLVNNIVSPILPTISSFSSLLAPPNTPISPISSSSYSAITINNGLLSPTTISFSSSSNSISAPPNSPISNITIFNNNNSNNRIPRRNSREKNVTIDSVLANSFNNF